jgi:hypothetical protein
MALTKIKYLYNKMIIEYAGFKIDNLYCFYYDDIMIYLNEYKVKNELKKL